MTPNNPLMSERQLCINKSTVSITQTMANASSWANESIVNLTSSAPSPNPNEWTVWTTVWCVGLGVSSTCVVLQCVTLAVAAKCRKYDEIILTQLNIARVLNTVTELCVLNGFFNTDFTEDVVFALLFHTDFVLVWLMFLFSRNLYNKVVLVFTTPTKNLAVVSALVWILCMPVGLICPFMLNRITSDPNTTRDFYTYWGVYAGIKFVILLINAFIFVKIFSVAVRRGIDSVRTGKASLKAAAVGFLLVFVTCLQVFANDLLSVLYQENTSLAYGIGVCNSFQGLPVTIIFVILAKNKIKHSMKSVMIRLREMFSYEQDKNVRLEKLASSNALKIHSVQ